MKRKAVCALLMLVLFAAVSFAGFASQQYVADDAWLLSDAELAQLQRYAETVSDAHGIGIYIVTVDDYTVYDSTDVFHAAIALYEQHGFGMGEEKAGAMLLLSMAERDFSFIVHGQTANRVVTDEGRDLMTRYFLDNFADNDWYGGFSDYIEWCEAYILQAQSGEAYSNANPPVSAEQQREKGGILSAVALFGPLPVAGIATWLMNARMKNVKQAYQASAYAVDGLQLSVTQDIFTHRSQTRRRIERESSSSGNSTQHSGSYSGTSGKF